MKTKNKNLRLFWASFFLVIIGAFFIFITDFSFGGNPQWGITFSPSYATDLGLNWQKAYLAILDDLKVENIRLSAYWDEIEKTKDQYDFSRLDFQINEATRRDTKIILAIGRRLPRWPECHDPAWLSSLTAEQTNAKLSDLIKKVVNRYKDNKNIIFWQVENEPMFAWFGLCPTPDENLLKSEVALVRSLDASRSIIVTDSGELSTWRKAAKYPDILGTTLYRIVWNKSTGFFSYWFLPPAFYHYKAVITEFFHPNIKSFFVMELQMEPWTMGKPMAQLSPAEQQLSFNLQRFQTNVSYAKKTGFSQVYLWGVEYWYWLKEQGQPKIWQEAKKLWD